MRKNIIATAVLLVLAVGAFAQAYTYPGAAQPWYYNQREAGELVVPSQPQDSYMGNNMLSFMLGGAFPMGDSGIDVGESKKPKWGDTGVQYGISYTRFLNEYFGVGIEISGMQSSDSTEHYFDTYGMYSVSETLTTSMELFNVMLTGRVNVNPQQKVRVYFPFGLGLTSAEGTLKSSGTEYDMYGSDYWSDKYTAKSSSLGYFIGAGVECEIFGDGRWVLGAELRYQGFTFDTDKFISDGPVNGKQHYKYTSLLAKLGYRF